MTEHNFLLIPAHMFLGWKPMKGKLGTSGPTCLSSDLCFNSFQNHSFSVASDPSGWEGRRGKRIECPLGMAPRLVAPALQVLAGVSAFEDLRNPIIENHPWGSPHPAGTNSDPRNPGSSSFFFNLYFGWAGSLLLCWAFSSCSKCGYSFFFFLLCTGFSLWWFLFLQSTGSRRTSFSICSTLVQ